MSRSVYYLMSREQRPDNNPGLVYAHKAAIERGVDLQVIFVLNTAGRVRSREHYQFMLDGLKQTFSELNHQGFTTRLLIGDGRHQLSKIIAENDPQLIVTDMSPLQAPRSLQDWLKTKVKTKVIDGRNTIPVDVASDHVEYAAHTFRRKVHKHLQPYLKVEPDLLPSPASSDVAVDTSDWSAAQKAVDLVKSSGIRVQFNPGPAAAKKALTQFVNQRLGGYANDRNDPTVAGQSDLSPYLHFGQISALAVAKAVIEAAGPGYTPLLVNEPRLASPLDPINPTRQDSANALLEELIVRRELSDNFCYYSKNGYRDLSACHDWAQSTLKEHQDDKRDHIYSLDQFESAQTHDPGWNAAQRQMMSTGKMHGYMRMYWAKKILEWSNSPDQAVKTAIYLNDHYSIDGGDPNGYVGILWSIGGLHDRPWAERPVFGKIRYMNAAGLARKFNLDDYIEHWTANRLDV